ncbi:signal peptide-containing protein, putative [Babesia ovata]|uniref:Signal peptide-containing protein, putative n=1 Tax=Babesia ovata TaxID=189622 RepID=A0A2H6KI25_9APIC|nr:signal peptide-containing protein, putative [Babesia ovata]GBE62640.1 signal peptide-containing protein, putative [Babesia ovata]
MRYGVLPYLGLLLLSGCFCVSTLRKHSLNGDPSILARSDLVSRLRGTKASNCSLVSCIGASNWTQRKALHDAFGIDLVKSAALGGPLRPRADLWELEQPDRCTLVVDVDIPVAANEPIRGFDRQPLLRLCQRSGAVLVHLNRSDIRGGSKSFRLSEAARTLLKDLAKIVDSKKGPTVYVFIPDLDTIKPGSSAEDVSVYEQFKRHLSDIVQRSPKFIFKSNGDEESVYRSISQSETPCTPDDIAKAISMVQGTNDTATTMAQIHEACFASHRTYVKDRLGELYKGSPKSNLTSILQSSMIDAILSFFLRTRNMNSDDIASHYVDQEYKRLSLFANDAYLRIVLMAAASAKEQLRSELGKDPKQDADALVNRIIADHDRKIADAMASLSNKMPLPEWVEETIGDGRDQLRDKLEAIVSVHTGLPKPTMYAKHEKAIERNYSKSKKKRGVNFTLALSCMLREHGYGNRQGYFNYQWGPLLFTLGYANDRDIAEAKPGTGILTPAFRLQPRLHVNIKL